MISGFGPDTGIFPDFRASSCLEADSTFGMVNPLTFVEILPWRHWTRGLEWKGRALSELHEYMAHLLTGEKLSWNRTLTI